MISPEDTKFEEALAELYRQRPAAQPSFEPMWTQAERLATMQAKRRRRAAGLVLVAACLVAGWFSPWASRHELPSIVEQQAFDFESLNLAVQKHIQPPTALWSSPTQIFVDLLVEPELELQYSTDFIDLRERRIN